MSFVFKYLLFCLLLNTALYSTDKPNIILVISDDQGYGDLACHGHPYLQTPSIDKLASESVSLKDFHVFPTCSPTRAALMTGHWANRTGVWHTIMGRSLLRKNEVTLAKMLSETGYETGIFGKWHLGDAYPFRPEDKGFTTTYYHGAGGVGQTPDVWNNSYFDGAYYSGGKIVKAEGYCTDVFFEQGNAFIKKQAASGKPFFAYISTNAPHSPLLCPQKYIDPYLEQGLKEKDATFLGMITNIDENVGKTRALVEELGITNNTIFIFMTDNGTAHGNKIFNANMRGKKGSEYEGGHRVPFVIHYPAGGLSAKKEVSTLTHVVDVAPTLLELCGVLPTKGVKFDGVSIAPTLRGEKQELAERVVITDSQRVVDPIMWRKSAVMTQDWRLVNGKELYYMPDDPAQESDLAATYPEKVVELRIHYEKWWAELLPTFAESAEFIIGNAASEVVTLTAHDWISPRTPAWNQASIRNFKTVRNKNAEGYWAVDVEKAGEYQLKVYRWAPESGLALGASVLAEPDQPGFDKPYSAVDGLALELKNTSVKINGQLKATKKLDLAKPYAEMTVKLSAGKQKLSVIFETEKKDKFGVHYLQITKK